jgi:phosphoribosyl 1,2-cyclic phosphate phosphodiesterase
MEVTLLGTGDTTGTPTVGCDCATCERARDPGEELRERLSERGVAVTASGGVERTRFSVHVRNEQTDESLLVDFSPDFRRQFLREDVALPDTGIVTHIHFDHLDGLGNAYRLFDALDVYAADETDPVTGASVAETVANSYDYLDQVSVEARSPFSTFETCGFEVRLVPVEHPPLVCYGLALEQPETGAKLSLSGDTGYGLSEQARATLADPDLFLADAIAPAHLCDYHPRGGQHHDDGGVPRTFGDKHMTREGALSLAEDLDADRTRLVHISHFYPADEAFEHPLALDGERYQL